MTKAIIIQGMHRSGTSCLTGCLKNLGLNLGEVSNFNKYNQKGNQENNKVFRLNESILQHNGGSWHNPVEVSSVTIEHKNSIRELITVYNNLKSPWGIKDPRMLLTYEHWKDLLPDHKIIGTIRHPRSVVESLMARKNLSVSEKQGYLLWSHYNQQLINLYNDKPFPIINFDLPNAEYSRKVKMIAESLHLNTDTHLSFYDNKLINQQTYGPEDCPSELIDQYKKLLSLTI